MRTTFDDNCLCCRSVNTYREQTGNAWQIFCRDCGQGEVFIDFAEFEPGVPNLTTRIDKLDHSEEKRLAMVHKWFTY